MSVVQFLMMFSALVLIHAIGARVRSRHANKQTGERRKAPRSEG